jgi:hypothetical protein
MTCGHRLSGAGRRNAGRRAPSPCGTTIRPRRGGDGAPLDRAVGVPAVPSSVSSEPPWRALLVGGLA